MVREAYFDAPNLGRLIQDVWNNPGFVLMNPLMIFIKIIKLR